MLRPIAASVPAHFALLPHGNRADTRFVERSRRLYFLLLTLASVLGWTFGLWAVPIVAFAVLEGAWTVAEWTRERRSRSGAYVR